MTMTFRILAVGALAVAALSSPACFLFQGAPARSDVRLGVGAEKTPSLDLRVENSSGQLILTWNSQSELIEKATAATLTIIDADHKEDVDLDLATLRNGSITYSPVTGEVSFRLEVRDAKSGMREAASVMFSGTPPPAVPRITAPAKDVPLALRVERSSGQLLVAWTRECAIIQNATRATLIIVDGDHTEDVDLDLATLRNGSILYSSVTADVSFRLEVIDATRGAQAVASARDTAQAPPPDKPPSHVVD